MMGNKGFQKSVERYFTPQVRYIMSGGKTHVVVYLPTVRLRGGYYANVNREWRVIPCQIEME